MEKLPTIRFGYVGMGEAGPLPANDLDERDPDLPATITVDRARFERLREYVAARQGLAQGLEPPIAAAPQWVAMNAEAWNRWVAAREALQRGDLDDH